MSMLFSREVIIINGFPVMGEITVDAVLQDGLPYFDVEGFEPETPLALAWDDVATPLKEWLEENKARIVETTFKRS